MQPCQSLQAFAYIEWADRSVAWNHRRWWQAVPDDGDPVEQLHVPHGGVELRWRRGEPPVIAGPACALEVETLDPGAEVVGYRFDSGRWPDLPHCSVSDLTGKILPFDDVLRTAVGARSDAPAGVRARTLFRALDSVLRERPATTRVHDIVDSIRGGAAPVRALARDIGWSERHARRRIRAMTGLGVGELRQLGRFQRFVSLVQRDVARSKCRSIVDLAVAAGYADQSHLHRACRAFTGCTPKRYLGRTHERCVGHRHHAAFAAPFDGTPAALGRTR